MRHIKKNLKRRRKGERELSFIEFKESLTAKELKELEKDAKAADALRNAAFYVKKKNLVKAFVEIARCIYNRPGYIIDKIKHNLLKKK
jgi:hypothetical protein